MYLYHSFNWGNKVTCRLLGILMVGVNILGDEFKYAVLFFFRMARYCLGLHDENIRCEVITIQNYSYALVSCQIFLSTNHAVSAEKLHFEYVGVTCLVVLYKRD